MATLLTQGAYDAATGATQTNWPKGLYNLMVAAFGKEKLTATSPAQLVDCGLRARLSSPPPPTRW